MLSRYLTPDMMRLQIAAPDRTAAIRAAGDLLVQAGVCTAAYVDAIVEAVEDNGPYIVLAPGLALAHARPESGVLALGISLVTLEPPVVFGAGENDPVSVVIAFSAVDASGHIELLSELAHFLGVDRYHERIRAARTPDEVLRTIQNYEINRLS